MSLCFHSGVVKEQNRAVIPESLQRHSRMGPWSGHKTISILIYHLDLYLKSILHKSDMFSQMLWYVDNFSGG